MSAFLPVPRIGYCDVCSHITVRPIRCYNPTGQKVILCSKACFLKMLDKNQVTEKTLFTKAQEKSSKDDSSTKK